MRGNMTIEPQNNNWDLETIEIKCAGYTVGACAPGRAAFMNWLVLWRDETMLMIARADDRTQWYPAHIYQHCQDENWHGFILYDPNPNKPDPDDADEAFPEDRGIDAIAIAVAQSCAASIDWSVGDGE